jgi:hypothetical protein
MRSKVNHRIDKFEPGQSSIFLLDWPGSFFTSSSKIREYDRQQDYDVGIRRIGMHEVRR